MAPNSCPLEPPRLVELVHAHVDEDAAAVGAKVRAWRLPVPLEAGNRVDVAQLAGVDALLQPLQRRHEAPPEADLEGQPCVSRELRRLLGLRGDDANRLLAQDRQVCLRPGA